MKRAKLKEKLSEYISADAIEAFMDGRPLNIPKIQAGRIEFIFVLVRAESPEQLSERIGVVAGVGVEHDALVHSMVGPMVIMAFGAFKATQHSPESRAELVNHLHQRFGNDLKIVHGAADGHFGSFGSATRISYSFTFPRFDSALATLGRLEFGQTEELRS